MGKILLLILLAVLASPTPAAADPRGDERCMNLRPLCWERQRALCICDGFDCRWICVDVEGP